MADATKFPPDLKFFQWSTPDAPNPALAAPLAPGDTTAYFTAPPLDHNGDIITGNFLMGVRNSSSYVMTCWVAAGAVAADGLSATVVQGIDLEGLDYTVGDSDLIPAAGFSAGDAISCNISGVIGALYKAAINGTIATGGTGFTIGTEPGAGGETVTIYRTTTAGVKLGVLRWLQGTTKVQYSNNGVDWVNIDSVSASNLVAVSAADTTPNYLQNKITAGDGLDEAVLNPAGDEALELSVDVTDIIDTNYGLTEDTNNIRINLGTDPGLEFVGGALEAKVDPAGGISKGAAGLALTQARVVTMTAGETIDGSVNAVPVGTSLGGKDSLFTAAANGFGSTGAFTVLNFGDTDSTYKISQSFTYTNPYMSAITLSKIIIPLRKVGTPADNLTVEVQETSGGTPNNTIIANGTSATVAGAGLVSTASRFTWVTFTFATPPTITSGAQLAICVRRSGAIDAANYYQVIDYAASVYASQIRARYTLSTNTWGNTSANDWAVYLEFTTTADGRVYKLDADNRDILNYIGWTKSNVVAGGSVDVQTDGVIDTLTGLTTGAPVFASTTAGSYTHTPSTADGVAQIFLGVASSATSLIIQPQGVTIGADTGTIFNSAASATATSSIRTAEVASGSIAMFIKTGFRPNRVKATGVAADSAALSSYYNVESHDGYQVYQAFTSLNASNQFVTAQSVVTNTISTTFAIDTFAANGFYIGTIAKNFGSSGETTLSGFIATSN